MARESVRAMFGNLKSRITGRRQNDEEEYYDDAEYDDYEEDYEDDYGSSSEYDSYGSDRSYVSDRVVEDSSQRFAAELDARYSKAVTTRPSRSYQSPRLVSIDDVRSSTAVYTGSGAGESGSYGSEEHRSSSWASGNVTPVGTAASSVVGASGLDSLFAATGSEGESWGTGELLGGAGTRRFGATRSLEVVRPLTYAEAERVAKGLKAGDAVVLSLKSTPDQIASRLVDFAFGVACALDATVERLCPKVYAITLGADLSDNERTMLKNQGVI